MALSPHQQLRESGAGERDSGERRGGAADRRSKAAGVADRGRGAGCRWSKGSCGQGRRSRPAKQPDFQARTRPWFPLIPQFLAKLAEQPVESLGCREVSPVGRGGTRGGSRTARRGARGGSEGSGPHRPVPDPSRGLRRHLGSGPAGSGRPRAFGKAPRLRRALPPLGAPAVAHPGARFLPGPHRLARADPRGGALPAHVRALQLLHRRAEGRRRARADHARGADRGPADLPLHPDRRRGPPRPLLRPLLQRGRGARRGRRSSRSGSRRSRSI